MADCRMIAIYCKAQSLAEIVKQIQELVVKTAPLIEAQHQILESNKEDLVKNQMSKPEIAAMLKNSETLEATLLHMRIKIHDAKILNQYLQKNLILHYHLE